MVEDCQPEYSHEATEVKSTYVSRYALNSYIII